MAAPPPQLPGIFHTLAPVLDHYGYLAVAAFILVEDFGIPVPGETILIAGAIYAGAGRLNIVLIGIVAFIAAIVGDNIGYGIGYFGGRRLVLRWGKYVFITPERLDKAENWFRRHGAKIVTVARFIEGLRQANGLVAGITKMHWKRFAAFNALGAALWVGVWTTVGYVSGTHIDAVYGVIRRGLVYVVGVILLAIAVRIGMHVYRRRHRSGEDAGPARGSSDEDRQPGAGATVLRQDSGGRTTADHPAAGGSHSAGAHPDRARGRRPGGDLRGGATSVDRDDAPRSHAPPPSGPGSTPAGEREGGSRRPR